MYASKVAEDRGHQEAVLIPSDQLVSPARRLPTLARSVCQADLVQSGPRPESLPIALRAAARQENPIRSSSALPHPTESGWGEPWFFVDSSALLGRSRPSPQCSRSLLERL